MRLRMVKSWIMLMIGTIGLGANVAGQDRGVALVGGTVITMGADGVLENHTVLVAGDSVVAVGPTAATTVPAGFQRVDVGGAFVTPGLTDMHVHLSGAENLVANLRYGITSVLQMSGQRGAIVDFLGLRDDIEQGRVLGPRLFLTGPMFADPGLARQTTAYVYDHADSVPGMLQRHVRRGYDFIKVHNMTPPDVYRMLVTSSRVPVIGHIPVGVTAEESLASGQAMMAHSGLFYYEHHIDPSCPDGFWECMAAVEADLDVIPTLADQIAQSGVFLTANLSYLSVEQTNDDDWQAVLDDPEFVHLDSAMQARWGLDNPLRRSNRDLRRRDIDNQVEFNRQLVLLAHQRGVPILAGTDAGVEGLFPGKAMALELRDLVAAGLSPFDALRSATATPGEFFARYVPRSPRLGKIVPGFAADLVVFDADPLANIDNVRHVRGTMSRGVWYGRASLDRLRQSNR